jgi:hypothetical protein
MPFSQQNFAPLIFQLTSSKTISIDELDDNPVDIIIDSIIEYSLKLAPGGEALKMIQ